MIEFIAFSVVIFLFFMLLVRYVRLSLKLTATTLELIKANVDKSLITDKFSELAQEPKDKQEPAAEAFLKFISDSRDWAYQYIDEVQESLNKFITDIEPEINYFKEYGAMGAMAPNYYSMKKITESFEELKKLLPDDYDKINT